MNLAATLRLDGMAAARPAKEIEAPEARKTPQPRRNAKQQAMDDALSARLASVSRARDRFRGIVPENPALGEIDHFSS